MNQKMTSEPKQKRRYYDILEINPQASMKEVKQAYRANLRKYHPDLNPETQESLMLLQEVREAYNCLKDPLKRANYNKIIGLKNTTWKEDPIDSDEQDPLDDTLSSKSNVDSSNKASSDVSSTAKSVTEEMRQRILKAQAQGIGSKTVSPNDNLKKETPPKNDNLNQNNADKTTSNTNKTNPDANKTNTTSQNNKEDLNFSNKDNKKNQNEGKEKKPSEKNSTNTHSNLNHNEANEAKSSQKPKETPPINKMNNESNDKSNTSEVNNKNSSQTAYKNNKKKLRTTSSRFAHFSVLWLFVGFLLITFGSIMLVSAVILKTAPEIDAFVMFSLGINAILIENISFLKRKLNNIYEFLKED